jgi:GNAT superfamily N-acetyltransferase
MSSVEIVHANATHEDDIKEMLGLFFKEGMSSVPYLNTDKNIERFYIHVILPLIIRGDPVLLAVKNGEAVGLNCLTTQLNEEYDLEYKTIHGIMTFVKEAHRRQGIGLQFKKYLFDWVIKNEYERAIGEWTNDNAASHAHTRAMLREFDIEIDRESTQYVAKLQ